MKKIYSCTDDYPSCRKAEATGEFCVNKCEVKDKITDTNTKESMRKCQMGFGSYPNALQDANNLLAECYGAIGKLEAEVAELKKDAERYRWIKENITEELTPNSLKGEFAVEHKTVYKLPYLMAWADFCGQINFDEAIDMKIKPE